MVGIFPLNSMPSPTRKPRNVSRDGGRIWKAMVLWQNHTCYRCTTKLTSSHIFASMAFKFTIVLTLPSIQARQVRWKARCKFCWFACAVSPRFPLLVLFSRDKWNASTKFSRILKVSMQDNIRSFEKRVGSPTTDASQLSQNRSLGVSCTASPESPSGFYCHTACLY